MYKAEIHPFVLYTRRYLICNSISYHFSCSFSRAMTPKCGTHCVYFVGQAFLCLCLTTFIFWLIFLPKEPKFTVSDASLSRFNFTNTDNTLYYNLALNVTIRNPNKRVGIYYRRIQVFANYRKKRFANVTLPLEPFYQGRKNTTTLNHVLVEGQQLVAFGEHDLSQFNSETAAGVYSIDVEIYLRVKARYGKVKTSDYGSSNIDCKLKVPVSSNNTSVSGFNPTKCRNVHVLRES
ncbi:NDR1/HIN1-like protein 10 [Pyrus x bretschneideri]|uniref:NDR1/HIN1-like protein 10 n=1 Tax=Pyrus x bretschneideri TaxID=225117 RepID=UPI0020309857|nr:NDR1/HIN1-like protein 10 [Pyrus x bretschneideri]